MKNMTFKKITSQRLFLPIFCLALVLLVNIVTTPNFFAIEVRNGRFIGSQISNVQRYVFFQYIVFSAVVAVRVPTLKKRSPPECLAAFRTDFTRITGINAPTRRSGGYTSYRKDPPGTTRRCA